MSPIEGRIHSGECQVTAKSVFCSRWGVLCGHTPKGCWSCCKQEHTKEKGYDESLAQKSCYKPRHEPSRVEYPRTTATNDPLPTHYGGRPNIEPTKPAAPAPITQGPEPSKDLVDPGMCYWWEPPPPVTPTYYAGNVARKVSSLEELDEVTKLIRKTEGGE